MTPQPHFTEDVSKLPTSLFGPPSLTWWGVMAFMAIEAAGFAMVFAAYFFLMSHEQSWPPEPWRPPDLLAGTLFTLVMLASEWPNLLIKKAAKAHDTNRVRTLMLWPVGIGVLLLVLRGFEFTSLNVRWWDNAYGSVIWALLFLHTLHMATDWIDTIVLERLMRTPLGYETRRMIDVDENSLYWRFVWLTWLPIYVLIYWLPRLAP
jgi:cytochrome c oxidase subunit III